MCFSNNSIEEDAIVSISVDTFQENDGYKLFNITGVLVYNETLLPHQATIYCNLTIPNTDYYMEQMIGYKSGKYYTTSRPWYYTNYSFK